MKFKYAKIFLENRNSLNFVFENYIPDTMDYYSFLKQARNKNFSPFLLNSKILIDLMTELFIGNEYSIAYIRLAENDEMYMEQINKLIGFANVEKEKIVSLLNELAYLKDEECVEITSVAVKNNFNLIEIKSNGLIKTGERNFDETKSVLKTILRRKVHEYEN